LSKRYLFVENPRPSNLKFFELDAAKRIEMSNISSFIWGVFASVCAQIVGYAFTRVVSLPGLYPYMDIRGEWKGEYELDGVTVRERIHVTHQFWKWCRGTFIWTNPDDEKERVEYRFSASFRLANTCVGYIKMKSRRKLDVGTFLIVIDHDGKTGKGGIVSMDFKTNQPRAHTYHISRLPHV
jgi:hypothetical protein